MCKPSKTLASKACALKTSTFKTWAMLGLTALSTLAVTAAQSEDYPTKPVKWVVAYPRGSWASIFPSISASNS
jgi:hypothetical protein